ncbi:MAG: DNA primase [Candidatus Kapaibacterium sp.]|nr:MAG: DNA primase [Candidatus Kapabacteria bacterium]
MRIPEHILEQVRRETDIVEVIGDVVPLKQRGRNYLGLCPFHTEKTPSFNVLPDKGIFKCFGCGKGGDAIHFLREYQKLSYVEAVRVLAERLGIALPETDSEQSRGEANRYEAVYNALKLAANFYAKNLYAEIGTEALQYVRRRGFGEQTLQTFMLGYAPESFTATMEELQHLGFGEEALLDAGLLGKKEETGRVYDRFRGRLMFPIVNQMGRVIGFGGRRMRDDDAGKASAKYLNSPQSLAYNKSEVLYGIFQAKDALRRLEYGILVEGYADVLSVHQAGFHNVVASSGTALTKEQLKLLSRFCKRLKIVYDADAAGIRAAVRGLDLAVEEGFDVEIVRLPKGDDPDSIIQRDGADAFQMRLDHALSLVDFKGEIFREEGLLENPEGKAEAVHSLMETIAKVPDRIKRDFMIQSVSLRFGLRVEDLYAELTQHLRKQQLRVMDMRSRSYAEREEPRRKADTTPQDALHLASKQSSERSHPSTAPDISTGISTGISTDAPSFLTSEEQQRSGIESDISAEELFPEEAEILRIALNNRGAMGFMKHRLGLTDEFFLTGLAQHLFMAIDDAATLQPNETPLETMLQGIAAGNADTRTFEIIGLAVRKETPSENWRTYNVSLEEDSVRILRDSTHRLQMRRLDTELSTLHDTLRAAQTRGEIEREFALLRQIQIASTEKRRILALMNTA